MANIIIMNLSMLRENQPERTYISDLGTKLTGKNTADAPLKYIIEYLETKNEKPGKILTVVTDEAVGAFDELKKMLLDYDSDIPEPVRITGTDEYSTVIEVLSHVKKGDKVYIEATGGLRNTTYTLMALVRILEYSGVTLEKAVYSDLQKGSIEDITGTYKMFDLISAVNSFTSFGSADELEKYFAGNNDRIIKETISAMRNFSDDITLCRVSGLDETLEALNDCLVKISQTELGNKDSLLFRALAEHIRSKFYIDGCKNTIEYPDIVRWCLDNRLIQQAVTVFTEKMPKFFYDKRFFTVSDAELEVMKRKNEKSNFSLEYDLFYSGLMNDAYVPWYIGYFKNIVINGTNYDKEKKAFEKIPDEKKVFDALVECQDMYSFINRIKNLSPGPDSDTEIFAKKLKKFFRIKRELYNDNGDKKDDRYTAGKISAGDGIYELLKNITLANNAAGFVKNLVNSKKILMNIFDYEEKYDDAHLNFICTLADRKPGATYNIMCNADNESLVTLFRDIYYVKTFVRNRLNHASEDECNEEITGFFSQYERYSTDPELTIEKITALLRDTLDRIKIIMQ